MNDRDLDAILEKAMSGFDEMERALFERGVNWAFDQLLKQSVDRSFAPRPDSILENEISRMALEIRHLKQKGSL